MKHDFNGREVKIYGEANQNGIVETKLKHFSLMKSDSLSFILQFYVLNVIIF